MPSFVDLTGKRYGKLVVKERFGYNKHGRIIWSCKCDCGNTVNVLGYYLQQGYTRSCGCLRDDLRKKNTYSMRGKYGKIIFDDGSRCIFDKDLYSEIKKAYWFKHKDEHVFSKYQGRQLHIARYIMELNGVEIPDGYFVDHINRDPLDNRLSNLRVCTHGQNMKNRSYNFVGKSGHTGVYKNGKKWKAVICCDGIVHNLGLYENIDDAIKARKIAEKEYFGEFAPK